MQQQQHMTSASGRVDRFQSEMTSDGCSCLDGTSDGAHENCVDVVATTWMRDSHDLFDYESRHVTYNRFTIPADAADAKFVRADSPLADPTKSEVALAVRDPSHPDDRMPLLRLARNETDDGFVAKTVHRRAPIGANDDELHSWVVVRHSAPTGYCLHEGDLIKLGRYQMLVKQIILDDDASSDASSLAYRSDSAETCMGTEDEEDAWPSLNLARTYRQRKRQLSRSFRRSSRCSSRGNESGPSNRRPSRTVSQDEIELSGKNSGSSVVVAVGGGTEESKKLVCKICLMEGAEDDDPMIAPCNCSGSIRYVHLSCLRRWINGRLDLPDESDALATCHFFYKQLSCELCKQVYPTYVKLPNSNSLTTLVEVPQLRAPIIVLESLACNEENADPTSMSSTSSLTPSGLHVISLADNTPVVIGRGHESQVRITDVSISRKHASLRYENGHVFIQDLMSKFGTLVAVRGNEIPLPADGAPTAIQVGRTLFSLSCTPSIKLPDSFDVDDAKDSVASEHLGNVPRESSISSPSHFSGRYTEGPTAEQQQHHHHQRSLLSSLRHSTSNALYVTMEAAAGGGNQRSATSGNRAD
ncbi:hypothetical protein FOL47_007466 [Perkinsus chesapeaki]|uniref:Uncharacterized protein n=1 Tax=Perkinsus chesapeaki TaxID=330153 RepID=A0A7J6LL18_PERCH|nr:hypothetical protein FOL47_007466 [Perkinsus chesapeaki]